jgi:hypothetical protein
MVDFNDIDSSKIQEGLLLTEEQVEYLFLCTKDSIEVLSRLEESIDTFNSKHPEHQDLDSHVFLKKMLSDLKHCVTILRKENDL